MRYRFHLLFILAALIICCSKNEDKFAEFSSLYIKHQDSLLTAKINTAPDKVRRYIIHLLKEYPSNKYNQSPNYSKIEYEIAWFIDKYIKQTNLDELQKRFDLYKNWSRKELSNKISLDSTFSHLNNNANTKSFPISLKKLLPEYENLNDSFKIASIFYQIGDFYFNKKINDSAITYFDKSVEVAKHFDNLNMIGDAWFKKSIIYHYRLENRIQADIHLYKSEDIFNKLNQRDRLIYIWNIQGHSLYKQSFFDKSSAKHKMVADTAKMKNIKNLEAQAYNYIAEAYIDLENFDSALIYCEYSIKIRETINSSNKSKNSNIDLANSFCTKALIKQRQKSFKHAKELLDEAFEIFISYKNSDGIRLCNERKAWLDVDMGNFIDAEQKFMKNLSLGTKNETILQALYGLGVCYYRLNDNSKALEYLLTFDQVIDGILNQIDFKEFKKGMIGDKSDAYELISILYKEKFETDGQISNLDSALKYIEKNKARSLFEMMDVKIETTPEIDSLVLLKSKLLVNLLNPEIDQSFVKDSINTIRSSLLLLQLNNQNKIKNINVTKHNDNIRDIVTNQMLKDDEMIIEYVLSPYGSFMFFITNNLFTYSPITLPFDSIKALTTQYYDLISSPESKISNNFTELGKTLYDIFIPHQIIEKENIKHLIIIPTDLLYSLPVETFINQYNQFLIENNRISYANSIHILESANKRKYASMTKKQIVSFGDPIISNGLSFEPIPYTAKEIKSINSKFKSAQSDIFLSSEATESAFKSYSFENVQYLHIASHGYCNFSDPDQSGILFSPSTENAPSDMLHIDEFRNLKIPVKLTFLSACQTGTGKVLPGEGVMGLANPFILAGSKSVIVTLWKIDDRASSKMVPMFYDYLLKGLPISEALSSAKNKMINSDISLYKHPFYWAPFIYIGSNDI